MSSKNNSTVLSSSFKTSYSGHDKVGAECGGKSIKEKILRKINNVSEVCSLKSLGKFYKKWPGVNIFHKKSGDVEYGNIDIYFIQEKTAELGGESKLKWESQYWNSRYYQLNRNDFESTVNLNKLKNPSIEKDNYSDSDEFGTIAIYLSQEKTEEWDSETELGRGSQRLNSQCHELDHNDVESTVNLDRWKNTSVEKDNYSDSDESGTIAIYFSQEKKEEWDNETELEWGSQRLSSQYHELDRNDDASVSDLNELEGSREEKYIEENRDRFNICGLPFGLAIEKEMSGKNWEFEMNNYYSSNHYKK